MAEDRLESERVLRNALSSSALPHLYSVDSIVLVLCIRQLLPYECQLIRSREWLNTSALHARDYHIRSNLTFTTILHIRFRAGDYHMAAYSKIN